MSIPSEQALLDVVRQAVVTVLSAPAESLNFATRLVADLSADSLALVEIVEVSEEQLRAQGVSVWVDDETLSKLAVLGDLVRALQTAKPRSEGKK
jgi:acyl carrier protein